MFIGHSVLAFALAASVATRRGWSASRTLRAGAVAGLFGAVPDIDIVYAVVGLLAAVGGDLGALVAGFWEASTVTHRGVTHSVLVAGPAAAAFAGWPDPRLSWPLAAGIVALALVVSGPLAAVTATLFVAAGLAVGIIAAVAFDRQTTALLAAVGLGTAPFGDLLTGEPPPLLYPLDVTLLEERVSLFVDPTLNLLVAFGVELGVLWLGLAVFAGVIGRRLSAQVGRRALLGVGYGAAVLAVPAPTIDVAYRFVFSVLAVGVVGVTTPGWGRWLRGGRERPSVLATAATALAAVTVAAAAYTVAYLLV